MSEDRQAGEDGQGQPCNHLWHAPDTLSEVTLYALGDDGFRGHWERCVRDYADQVCGAIAGLRMSGTESIAGPIDVEIPLPPGFDEGCVTAAFYLAASGEISRRLDVMMDASPGQFG